MGARLTAWERLGQKLGPFAEPLAIALLGRMERSASGLQRLALHWHRGVGSAVRLEDETIIEPQDPVVAA